MIFNCPWFGLLIPLPFLMWFFVPCAKQKKENCPEIFFPAIDRLKAAFSNDSSSVKKSNFVLLALIYLSWVFLSLALMQPEKVDQFRQVKTDGYDLLLAVDVSASMQAVDFSTATQTITRLDATKEVVSKFVTKRQGDRVGLITFGESAYLLVPLSFDTLSVRKMLANTEAGMAGNATAIGDAIGLAVRTLRDKPEGSRVLVLLTDGEDNASSIGPLQAAKLAKQYGIKIYTIGVGKKGAVPFSTNFGYQMMNVSIDEKLLKEISEMTGAKYFSATDKTTLESIYSEINTLEKTKSEESVYLIREPLYRYPLTLSVIILFTSLLFQFFKGRALC